MFYFAFTQDWHVVAEIGVSLAVFGVAWVLSRLPKRTILASKVYLSGQFFCILLASLQDGQAYSESLFLIFVVPLGTAYLLDVRETVVASAACAVAIVIVALSTVHFPLPETRGNDPMDWMVLRLVGIAVATACAISTAQATRRERRALELHGEELERARRTAEAASHTKSTFLANMSHEIRTPLNGVLGMVQELRERDLPARDSRAVEIIHQSSEHLLQLLNELLSLARLDCDRASHTLSDFDLRSILQEVQALFSSTLRGAGVELRLSWEDRGYWVRGDKRRFKQILCNLLGHAIKLSEGDRIEMHLQARRHEGSNAGFVASVCIRDSSVISSEDIDRLFRSADHSTTHDRDFWGLGLEMSKKLAQGIDGDVTVRSDATSGTSFCLTLPFAPALDPTGPTPSERPKSPSATTTFRLPSYRILVVDDNDTNRMVLLRSLERWGCKVMEAQDGEEAVLIAARESFDLILMDIRMPRMDGLEAARFIRDSQGPNRKSPIVAVTAHAYPEDLENCKAAGMQGHLSKPFRLDALHAIVAQHAESSPSFR